MNVGAILPAAPYPQNEFEIGCINASTSYMGRGLINFVKKWDACIVSYPIGARRWLTHCPNFSIYLHITYSAKSVTARVWIIFKEEKLAARPPECKFHFLTHWYFDLRPYWKVFCLSHRVTHLNKPNFRLSLRETWQKKIFIIPTDENFLILIILLYYKIHWFGMIEKAFFFCLFYLFHEQW